MKMRAKNHIQAKTLQSLKKNILIATSLSLVVIFSCYLVVNFSKVEDARAANIVASKNEKTGNWDVSFTWINNSIPDSDDNYEINGTVTKTGNLIVANQRALTIKAGDTLVVTGDLTISNQAKLYLETNAALIVRGNYTSHQQSDDVVQGGVLIVLGKFTFSGGGANIHTTNSSSYIYYDQTLNDPAYVNSSVSGPGTILGINTIPNSLFEATFGSPMPVVVTSFSGRVEGRSILLNWSVVEESGINYYQVERSATGNDFEKLGIVGAKANDVEKMDYDYLDDFPLKGNQYYRLAIVGFNGSTEYSKVTVVKNNNEQTSGLILYPTLITGNDISFKGSDIRNKSLKISVYDLSGRIVFSNDFQTSEDESYTLNFPAKLERGNYYVNFVYDNQLRQKKFIVTE